MTCAPVDLEAVFDVLLRPLLEAVEPSVVMALVGEHDGTASLRAWCSATGVHLDTVVARGDEPSRNALPDAGQPVDVVISTVTDDVVSLASVVSYVTGTRRGSRRPPAAVVCLRRELPAGMSALDVALELFNAADPAGVRAFHLPLGGGVLVAADVEGRSRVADLVEEFALPARSRELVAVVADATSSSSAAGAGADPDRTAALRRLVDRQDRQLAELRSAGRREDALARQVERLEHDLERLHARRSVRAVLRAAAYARPLFRMWRARRSWHELMARDRGARRGDRPQRPLRTHHEFASTDTGLFYDHIRPLVADGGPRFVDAWATSEEALRSTPPWPPELDAPLVSIVMPTRNRARLIQQAIDTVTDQSYVHWELLVCDDASEDDTEAVVASIGDDRIVYARLPRGGAAAARNAGLAKARGDLVAYLDTDNLWHPRFLEEMVRALVPRPGRLAAYANYVDVVADDGGWRVKRFRPLAFDYERLMDKNFIDLNSFVHRRSLYDRYGGFDERLVRQQDWDLILKYTFLRDPLYVDRFLALYRRNRDWGQITDVHGDDPSTRPAIEATVASYHRYGLPRRDDAVSPPPRVTVVSWDICRNHFSKAYNLAEAVAEDDPGRVQLLGFRFFEEAIFPPYANAVPTFRTDFQDGASFPAFDDAFARAVARVRGDVVYAVKPRLPSLGVALLANYHFGRPVVIESNDLESVVTSPASGQQASALALTDVDPADPRLRDPYGPLWTQIMEGLVPRLPIRTTHNHVLDEHFGDGAFYLRNPKDETYFDPDLYERDRVRADLGLAADERVLLFGGMVRRHKGVFQVAEVLDRLGPQWRLLVVGSRETPDQRRLRERVGDRLRIVEPMDRNAMARVNLAADAVVLWLDPDVPASHYQMPYKLTDALAMRVPVVANPIGELAHLGDAGYLRLVPHGDESALAATLDGLFDDPVGTLRMVEAGRRLYLRQFSYRAVREVMDLAVDAALATPGPLPVAEDFARFFARFRAAQRQGRTPPGTGVA